MGGGSATSVSTTNALGTPEAKITTNTIEGYFGIFRLGLKSIYQHCLEQHLQRFLNEFDFCYSGPKVSDVERAAKVLEGAAGKHLTYRWTDAA